MVEVRNTRFGTIVALCAAILGMSLTVSLAQPSTVSADGWTNYCNNTILVANQNCYGLRRTMNAAMGMGDQHSVCIWWDSYWPLTCSSGPGAWTYNPGDSSWYWSRPIIKNNASGSNVVHGVAWTDN